MRPQFSLQSYDFPTKILYINKKKLTTEKMGFSSE